jgi:hypothetical protein
MQDKTIKRLGLILFPLFLINTTTSANTWQLLGIGIGQAIYYLIIAIATIIVLITPYRKIGLFLLVISFGFLFIYLATQSPLADGLKVISLGILFMLAGGRIYGTNPDLLHKQLIIFFALCIPFMLAQIAGLSSFFMMWNTDYAHDLDILDLDEIGTFKVIPVFPTFMVGLDKLYYQIGQGRPSGLFHSNNVLSVFVAAGVGLNLLTSKSTKLRYSDFILMCILTLTMSLMAFSVSLILYTYFLVMGGNKYRIRAIKLFFILLFFIGLYYIFFPGLFLINFGEAKILMSFLTRGLDLANSLGFSAFNDLYSDQILLIGDAYTEEGTYSLFSTILKSKFVVPLIIAFLVVILLYLRGYYFFRKNTGSSTLKFNIFLFCCLISQFSTAYIGAPAYQFMIGFTFYPLLRKYWYQNKKIVNSQI